MPVEPCRSCLPMDGIGFLQEPANPFSVYSLESPPFVPVLNCPPGFDCAHAPFIFMNCCGTQLFADLNGTTTAQRNQKIQEILNRCNVFWESCNTVDTGGSVIGTARGPIVQPTKLPLFWNNPACVRSPCRGSTVQYCLPAGTVLSPLSQGAADSLAQSIANAQAKLGKVTLGNNRQCFTAACGGGDPFTTTQCIEASIYGECLFFPTPAEVNSKQIALDALALSVATANANAILAGHGCLVCNSAISGFSSCPGNPLITSSLTIPAGTYCQPSGTAQAVVDAIASQALFNQTQAAIKAQGCACTISVANNLITGACNTFAQFVSSTGSAFACPMCGSPNGSGIMAITVGVVFDWATMWQGGFGSAFHGVVKVQPIGYNGPIFTMNFP